MLSLLQRPKIRKPFQWALAYLARAWLVFQGIEVLAAHRLGSAPGDEPDAFALVGVRAHLNQLQPIIVVIPVVALRLLFEQGSAFENAIGDSNKQVTCPQRARVKRSSAKFKNLARLTESELGGARTSSPADAA